MVRQSKRAVYWLNLIDEHRQSGLTQSEFCQARGIKLETFRSWLYKRKNIVNEVESIPNKNSSNFLPVTIREPSPVDYSPIEIITPAGLRVAVRSGFDPVILGQIIQILEESSC